MPKSKSSKQVENNYVMWFIFVIAIVIIIIIVIYGMTRTWGGVLTDKENKNSESSIESSQGHKIEQKEHFTLPLKSPKNIKVSNDQIGGISVSWEHESKASIYDVSITKTSGDIEETQHIKTKNNSAEFIDLEIGEQYMINVTAIDDNGITGDKSDNYIMNPGCIVRELQQPDVYLDYDNTGNGKVTIYWNNDIGAVGYRLFISRHNDVSSNNYERLINIPTEKSTGFTFHVAEGEKLYCVMQTIGECTESEDTKGFIINT